MSESRQQIRDACPVCAEIIALDIFPYGTGNIVDKAPMKDHMQRYHLHTWSAK